MGPAEKAEDDRRGGGEGEAKLTGMERERESEKETNQAGTNHWKQFCQTILHV